MVRSWHTFFSRCPSKLRLSCLALMNHPLCQFIACVTEKVEPHGHFDGKFFKGLSYRRPRASRNSLLFKLNPWSLRGSAPSQLEAPGSDSCSRLFAISLFCLARIVFDFSFVIAFRDVKALSFAFLTSLWSGNSRDCSIIFSE